MNAILPRLEKRPPHAGGRPASPGKRFIRPARPVPPPDTLFSLAPVLRAVAVMIGLSLLLLMLGQVVAELVDHVRILLMPRI